MVFNPEQQLFLTSCDRIADSDLDLFSTALRRTEASRTSLEYWELPGEVAVYCFADVGRSRLKIKWAVFDVWTQFVLRVFTLSDKNYFTRCFVGFFHPFDLLHWLPKYLPEVWLPVLQHPLKQIIFFHVNRLQASRQTRPWHNLIMQFIPGLAESTNPIWSALCKLHGPRSQMHLMWVPICQLRCPLCVPHNCMAFYFKRKD